MTSPSVIAKEQKNDDDNCCCFTLIPADQASPQVLETVAIWLSEQWPRGGNANAYLDKITENNSSSGSNTCPCSFILMKNDNNSTTTTITPIGHGRILDCFENSGARAAAFTYVICKPQGRGHGRILMQHLEQWCRDQNYHYVYVWTHTAIQFYHKCGYHETHRVSLQRPCLKMLEATQVSKLEDLLTSRSRRRRILNDGDDGDYHDNAVDDDKNEVTGSCTAKKTSETILLPPVDVSEGAGEHHQQADDVWLCKRLVDTVPSVTIPRLERLNELQQFCNSSVSYSASCSCFYYYHLLDLPWQQQIGPSCGLAALQMVLDHFSKPGGRKQEQSESVLSETNNEPLSLLQQAQAQQYTRDGEIFNIQNLYSLAKDQNCCLDCELVLVSETTPIQVCQQLLETKHPIILPYDQEAYTRLPCSANGKSAHYGVIVGFMMLIYDDKPLVHDTTTSNRLMMTKESSWDSSNHSLHPQEKRLVSLTSTILDDEDDDDDNANDDQLLNRILLQDPSTAAKRLYLLVQHGMSRALCIASWDDFMTSNQQLKQINHVKFLGSSIRPLNLANQMLFFKEKNKSIVTSLAYLTT